MKIWDPDALEEQQDFDEFEGYVTDCTWEDTEYGERMVIHIQPTDFDGDIRTWRYKYSERKNSIWGKLMEAFRKIGLKISSEEDIIGKKFRWKYTDVEFGTDRDGNPIVTRILLPVAYLDNADVKTPSWSDDAIEKALKTISGKVSVNTFMENLGIPPSLKKKVIAIAASLDADGVILFDPDRMELNIKH